MRCLAVSCALLCAVAFSAVAEGEGSNPVQIGGYFGTLEALNKLDAGSIPSDTGAVELRLVQFNEPLTRADRVRLFGSNDRGERKYPGIELRRYVGANTYLECVSRVVLGSKPPVTLPGGSGVTPVPAAPGEGGGVPAPALPGLRGEPARFVNLRLPLWDAYLDEGFASGECAITPPIRVPGADPKTVTRIEKAFADRNAPVKVLTLPKGAPNIDIGVPTVTSTDLLAMLAANPEPDGARALLRELGLARRRELRGPRTSETGETPQGFSVRSPQMVDVFGAESSGLDGRGQVVNVIDSWPFDFSHSWFGDDQHLPGPDHRKIVRSVIDDAPDSPAVPHAHATFVAGIVAGQTVGEDGGVDKGGQARGALLCSTRLLDAEQLRHALDVAASGAETGSARTPTVHLAPWHYETGYDDVARAVDEFTWENEDALFIASAGTEESMGPPGTAKNALSVGAAWVADPDSTARHGAGYTEGLTSDGRRKPDLYAPGCNVRSARGDGDDVDDGWDLFNAACATSWAAPEAAAAAAMVRQYYMEGRYPSGGASRAAALIPSGALLKATLINTTKEMSWAPAEPSDPSGRSAGDRPGVLSLEELTPSAKQPGTLVVKDVRHVKGLTTGGRDGYVVTVTKTAAANARITLVWSDAARALTGTPRHGVTDDGSLVNDLDLVVTPPAGAEKPRLVGHASVEADHVNNVEEVTAPLAQGTWLFEVVGSAVTRPHADDEGQGYALVMRFNDSSVTLEQLPRIVPTPPPTVPTPAPTPPPPAVPPAPAPVTLTGSFKRPWTELNLAAGAGGAGDDEHGALWAADVDYRLTTFKTIPTSVLPGVSGVRGGRVFRKSELALGVSGHADDRADHSAFTSDGGRAWGYYDRSLRAWSPSKKTAWGVLAQHFTTKQDGQSDQQGIEVTPAFSFAWDSPGDCERNRAVVHASYADVENRQDLAVGVTLSFLRDEDDDSYDARCIEGGVFRRLDLDSHRSYHVAYEHREQSMSARDSDRQVDFLSFTGQVPLLRPAPGWRHVTFDWNASHAKISTEQGAAGAPDSQSSWTMVDVGVVGPIMRLGTHRDVKRMEFGLRFGIGRRWYDADIASGDEDDTVYSLTLHALFGRGRERRQDKGSGTCWEDVPESGSTLNPGSGTGPGTSTPIPP